MKNLSRLRRIMHQNGMVAPAGGGADSLEIIPFGDDLFDPMSTIEQSQPPGSVAEGGSCTSCHPGCQTCSKCENGCADGCPSCQSGSG